MKILTLILCSFILISCQALELQKTPQFTTKSFFDEKEFEAALQPKGNNTIKGSALIRQRGGGVVTCAGINIALFPVKPYSTERIQALYGNDTKGYNPNYGGRRLIFIPDEPNYLTSSRNSICNAQGFFSFDKVKDGEYYVVTNISWQVQQHGTEGGAMFQKIKVEKGETADLVITP